MNNSDFLKVIWHSFIECLNTSNRSNKKLIILHGAIAKDIQDKLGNAYTVMSLGKDLGKEGKLNGRYIEKTVDILILKGTESLAGIGVKFVMNNYGQNSNNYFENMLGETANIRCNGKAYFQILILPEMMPYFNNKNIIKSWDLITSHNIEKYITLSKDNIDNYLHTPIKTLLSIIRLPDCDHSLIMNRTKYKNYYKKNYRKLEINNSNNIPSNFGKTVILNDYEIFIDKLIHYIKSI